MEFLKKHYEKIVLSVVLLGLAVAAVLLSLKVRQVRNTLGTEIQVLTNPAQTELAPVDTRTYEAALTMVTNPPPLNLTSNHLLFNPVPWYRKMPDNVLIKDATGTIIGVRGVVVMKITPLTYTISFDGPGGSPENPRYKFTVERQAAVTRGTPRPSTREVSLNSKFGTNFIVKEIRGEAGNPTEAVLELLPDAPPAADAGPVTNEVITVTRDKPWVRAEAYKADLSYPAENLTWLNKRKDEAIRVGQEDYIIFAITDNQVVLIAPNLKRTTLSLKQEP
ncbi:MAG: hypothetical protein AB1705_15225 [Verrucomicrobiota bacterium]